MNSNSERQLNKQPKNFTFCKKENADSDVVYYQYLCTFKDNVTGEYYDEFCKSIVASPNLPTRLADFFLDIENSEVLDFTRFMDIIDTSKNVDMQEVENVANIFFDMLNFGDLRTKTAMHISIAVSSAMFGTFGNVKKDRRLIAEYKSVEANTNVVDIVSENAISRNDIGSVKYLEKAKEHQKLKVITE